MWCWIKSSFVDLDGWKNGGFGLVGVVFKGRLIKYVINQHINRIAITGQSFLKYAFR
ncbi:hypothetical protein [uncultured Gammaproteobacteria bacterium]|nr:hypothetical protein [uncultured Gammaproteobacteria bacterium]